VVLCQVQKAEEDMLNQLYTSIRLVLPPFYALGCTAVGMLVLYELITNCLWLARKAYPGLRS
jgi:hypothetical protein